MWKVSRSKTYHVWIFLRICDADVCELDVQVLKHASRGQRCENGILVSNRAEI